MEFREGILDTLKGKVGEVSGMREQGNQGMSCFLHCERGQALLGYRKPSFLPGAPTRSTNGDFKGIVG